MSLIASLARAYERLSDRPLFGFSKERIGFVVALHRDGQVAGITDIRFPGPKKTPQPQEMLVPTSFKRPGVTPRPFFLWDNANYALGLGLLSDAEDGRFAAFKFAHLKALAHQEDEGLRAFRAFVENWSPSLIPTFAAKEELETAKLVFALESERRTRYLHQRPAAQALWARCARTWMSIEGKESADAVCLVSGERSVIARTHPAIRGIPSNGGKDADSLVSFNLEAFASYGHEQGDNAPISEYAAFAYTTALNRFLERDSPHRLQIGDASTVFWADSSEPAAAELAERTFREMIDPAADAIAVQDIRDKLIRLRRGEKLTEIEPALDGVRFHVLGLAPNAARLSVRFYYEDDFGALAENYRAYRSDIALEPSPEHAREPSLYVFQLRTAPAMRDGEGRVKFDAKAISPLLAGELLRALLTGARFPRSLLSLLLMRVRGDAHLDAHRVALIKAVIARDLRLSGEVKEDNLMRTDPDDPDPARRLGRLFAVIERAQRAALGDQLNATVADKFLGAASATPGRVLPGLLIAARDHHIKRLRNGHADAKWIKDAGHARATAGALDRDIGLLVAQFDDGFPMQLSPQEQGLFLIGYYQERWGKTADASDSADIAEISNRSDEETAQ